MIFRIDHHHYHHADPELLALGSLFVATLQDIADSLQADDVDPSEVQAVAAGIDATAKSMADVVPNLRAHR